MPSEVEGCGTAACSAQRPWRQQPSGSDPRPGRQSAITQAFAPPFTAKSRAETGPRRAEHTRLALLQHMHSPDAIYRALPALLSRLQAVGRVVSGKARWCRHLLAAVPFSPAPAQAFALIDLCRMRTYCTGAVGSSSRGSRGHAGRRRQRCGFSCIHIGGHVGRSPSSSAAGVFCRTVRGECSVNSGSTIVLCHTMGTPPRVLGESYQSHPVLQAAGGSADPSAIREAVTDLWRRLDEQLHRIEAALPSGKALQQ